MYIRDRFRQITASEKRICQLRNVSVLYSHITLLIIGLSNNPKGLRQKSCSAIFELPFNVLLVLRFIDVTIVQRNLIARITVSTYY